MLAMPSESKCKIAACEKVGSLRIETEAVEESVGRGLHVSMDSAH